MDKLKQSKTSVEVELENNESHYKGGDVLTGQVLLTVNEQKGIFLKELTGTLICDVDIKIGENQAVDTTKNEKSDKIITRKMRLFNEEHKLDIKQYKLRMGQHTFPFRIPLPAQHPTLPPSVTDVVDKQTYGNINYYLKVKAKRGVSSWFSKSELSAKCPFAFMPVSSITANPHQKMHEVDFSSLVDMSKTGSLVGSVKKLFTPPSVRDKDPRMALYCTLKIPANGLRQDRPSSFELIVRPGDNTENIVVKWVTLSVETILSMKTEKLKCEHVISKTQLLQKMPLSKGNILDLSEFLRGVTVKQKMIPTFSTPMLSHLHRLRIELSILHSKSKDISQVLETVPIVVLSPHIVNKTQPPINQDRKEDVHTPKSEKSEYANEIYGSASTHNDSVSTHNEKHSRNNSAPSSLQVQREKSSGKPHSPHLSQKHSPDSARGPPLPARKPVGTSASPSNAANSDSPSSTNISSTVQVDVSPTTGEDAKDVPPPSYEEST